MTIPGAWDIPAPAFDRMGGVAFSALVCCLVAAFVTALLLDALYAAGVRRMVHRAVITKWLVSNFERRTPPAPAVPRRGGATLPPKEAQTQDSDASSGKSSALEAANRIVVSLTRLAAGGDGRTLFGLGYRQLCGQLAAGLQAESSLPMSERRDVAAGFAPALDERWIQSVLSERPPAAKSPYSGVTREATGRSVGRPSAIRRRDADQPANRKEGQEKSPETRLPTGEVGQPDSARSPKRGGLNQDEQARLSEAHQVLVFNLERGLDDLQAYLGGWWQRIDYAGAFFIAWTFVGMLVELAEGSVSGIGQTSSPVGMAFLVLALVTTLLVPFMRRFIARVSAAVG